MQSKINKRQDGFTSISPLFFYIKNRHLNFKYRLIVHRKIAR